MGIPCLVEVDHAAQAVGFLAGLAVVFTFLPFPLAKHGGVAEKGVVIVIQQSLDDARKPSRR